MIDFTGQVVVVTGAGRGLGRLYASVDERDSFGEGQVVHLAAAQVAGADLLDRGTIGRILHRRPAATLMDVKG